VLVLFKEFMVEAKGMEVVPHISGRAVVLLPDTDTVEAHENLKL